MSYQHRIECENLRHKLNSALKQAEAAEAKLAELEELLSGCNIARKRLTESLNEVKLYRPAPAADLAELVPAVCDGKEQYAFEAYARSKGMDLSQHPLHYLFLDGKTNQARSAWRECLVYVRAAILRNIEDAGKKHE